MIIESVNAHKTDKVIHYNTRAKKLSDNLKLAQIYMRFISLQTRPTYSLVHFFLGFVLRYILCNRLFGLLSNAHEMDLQSFMTQKNTLFFIQKQFYKQTSLKQIDTIISIFPHLFYRREEKQYVEGMEDEEVCRRETPNLAYPPAFKLEVALHTKKYSQYAAAKIFSVARR